MTRRAPFRSAGVGPLFTDLYEITMAQAYVAEGMAGTAVFEIFFRALPPDRAYIVAAGLDDVLDFVEAFRFTDDDLAFLRELRLFEDPFLRQLGELRFTGDIWAVPEGTLVFPNEPVLQVIAPIVQAQLLETYALNQIHFQSVIASKAARIVRAAGGRAVVDFGSRRAHGIDAALKAARSTYLAGGSGTSNLLASQTYGIPAFGTMAHSFVQAFDDECDAFAAFARMFPGTTLLVDTYDTLAGIERVIDLARRLGPRFDVGAVRLDSGDLAALAKTGRERLDAAGLERVRIFASSSLDEHEVARLLASGTPIDGFGVGTRLSIAADAPALDMAYKLVEYDGIARTKLSTHKTILPGRKQVVRARDGGVFVGDTICLVSEHLEGEPLLVPVVGAGRRVDAADRTLDAARGRLREQLDCLPEPLRAVERPPSAYPVTVSESILQTLERLRMR